MSVLFTEAFDVWNDNSSSFYKLFHGWVWLFVGFLLGFAFVERIVVGSGCLVGLCEGDPFLFARSSGVETYLFSSVGEGVNNR